MVEYGGGGYVAVTHADEDPRRDAELSAQRSVVSGRNTWEEILLYHLIWPCSLESEKQSRGFTFLEHTAKLRLFHSI